MDKEEYVDNYKPPPPKKEEKLIPINVSDFFNTKKITLKTEVKMQQEEEHIMDNKDKDNEKNQNKGKEDANKMEIEEEKEVKENKPEIIKPKEIDEQKEKEKFEAAKNFKPKYVSKYNEQTDEEVRNVLDEKNQWKHK